jgi:8-oxo-dGTP pyrophosphatase MutT (NUDIX family)
VSGDWKLLSTEPIQSVKIFALEHERYLSPRTGEPVDAIIAKAPEWVNVIALTPERQVVLVRQFRFGTASMTLEIPGGLVDAGETPLQSGVRELREETGYEAERWTPLGSVAPNPAYQRNHLHMFLAEGARLVAEQEQDPGEDITVELHALADIDAMIADGAIDHALVVVAFTKLGLLQRGLSLR